MTDPTQAVTAMEVVDTAVKIGLGALISGLATYWVTKLNHDKELEKQTIRRRRELLEQIAAGVEQFWNEYRRYFLVSLEAIHRAQTDDVIPTVIVDEYEARKQKVMESTNELSTAQSSLLLLGDKDSNEILITMIVRTEAYMRATRTLDTDKTITELKQMHDDILGIRDNFYSALSNTYNKSDFK
jgi:hypothetical protein